MLHIYTQGYKSVHVKKRNKKGWQDLTIQSVHNMIYVQFYVHKFDDICNIAVALGILNNSRI